MQETFLLLGSNEGDKFAFIRNALEAVQIVGKLKKVSSLYETVAWGIENQAAFLNQACVLETSLSAQDLLEKLLAIELSLGRKREKKWASRCIDIDILYFGQEVIQQTDLQIPHPYLHLRRFALVPLCEMASDFPHPIYKKTNQELLAACPDLLEVRLLKNFDY